MILLTIFLSLLTKNRVGKFSIKYQKKLHAKFSSQRDSEY